jgi:hypothetical protein
MGQGGGRDSPPLKFDEPMMPPVEPDQFDGYHPSGSPPAHDRTWMGATPPVFRQRPQEMPFAPPPLHDRYSYPPYPSYPPYLPPDDGLLPNELLFPPTRPIPPPPQLYYNDTRIPPRNLDPHSRRKSSARYRDAHGYEPPHSSRYHNVFPGPMAPLNVLGPDPRLQTSFMSSKMDGRGPWDFM